MLLAIDIGNSNVVLGLYADGDWKAIWRLPTLQSENPLAYYQEQLGNHLLEIGHYPREVERVVISSVVPELRAPFKTLAREFFSCPYLVLGPAVYPQLPIRVLRPEELGTDLYANALAAHMLYRMDTIIVDFGTALTFTILQKNGQMLGVNIAPGLKTAIHALFLKTAQLPEVPLTFPESVIGKNTTEAIQNGILVGYVGLVKHMLEAIHAEVGEHFRAVATGGMSGIMVPLHDEFHHIEPRLTLEGLRLAGNLL